MCVTGVPEPDPMHADHMAWFALACLAIAERYNEEHPDEPPVHWRIGAHSGEVIAAVVGRSRFLYDVYGDNVNVASRIESSGEGMRVRVSAQLKDKVQSPGLDFSMAEQITVKGKEKPLSVHWLRNVPDPDHILSARHD